MIGMAPNGPARYPRGRRFQRTLSTDPCYPPAANKKHLPLDLKIVSVSRSDETQRRLNGSPVTPSAHRDLIAQLHNGKVPANARQEIHGKTCLEIVFIEGFQKGALI